MIYDDGYELDEFGRARICPICQNEEISNNYCKICGSFLINRCVNVKCGIIAEGNARFCTNCGDETVFNSEGYLSSWNIARNQIEQEDYGYQEYLNIKHQEYLNIKHNESKEDDDLPF